MANVNGAVLKSALFLLILLADCRVNYAEDALVRVRRQSEPAKKSSAESQTPDPAQAQSKPPISENKTSATKLKLQNENLTGKKPLIANGTVYTPDHLLGANGTGQRKDYTLVPFKPGAEPITVPTPVVAAGSINIAADGKSKLLTKLTASEGYATNGTTSSTTTDPLSDAINIDTVERSEADLNTTLQNFNITQTQEDYHTYYNSVWTTDKNASEAYWKRLADSMNVSSLLSNSHRRATTVLLTFDFPYYGFPIRNITIATGGFLYSGDYVHSWLASTQYIAPLMANFDTSLSQNSFVKFRDDGETFTVVWENVSLQDRPENGSFTFSATLNKSGDIVFAYKTIPIDIQQIYDDKHPVKVGLSDAYIIDKTIFRTKQKTIYEYHRVNFGRSKVQNDTLITLYAQPTCFSYKDCQSCMNHEGSDFKCIWCPTLNRCSTGVDRKRQDWIQKGCDKTQIMEISVCPALGQKGNNYGEPVEISTEGNDTNGTYRHETEIQLSKSGVTNKSGPGGVNGAAANDDSVNKVPAFHTGAEQESSSSSLLVTMLVICCLVVTCGGWVLYAYRNPHTKSGQLLIRYRPNKWSWRRGEARYTAATIHM